MYHENQKLVVVSNKYVEHELDMGEIVTLHGELDTPDGLVYEVVKADGKVLYSIDRFRPATDKELLTLEVEQPSHYTLGGIETIDYIKAKLTPDEYCGYLKGNILKYMSRVGHKGDPLKDVMKAQVYTGFLVDHYKKG